MRREVQQLRAGVRRLSKRRLTLAAAGAVTLLIGLNAAPALAATTCIDACDGQDPFQTVASDALKLESDATNLGNQALKIEAGLKLFTDALKIDGANKTGDLLGTALKLYGDAHKLQGEAGALGNQALKLDDLALKWDADFLKLSPNSPEGYKEAVAIKLSQLQDFALKLDGFDVGLQQNALKLTSDYLKLVGEFQPPTTAAAQS